LLLLQKPFSTAGNEANGTISAWNTIVRGDTEREDTLFRHADLPRPGRHKNGMHVHLKLQPDPTLVSQGIIAGCNPSGSFGGSRPETPILDRERSYSPDFSEKDDKAAAYDVNWRLSLLQDKIVNLKTVRQTA
jgi:hypothetical protein